MTNPTTTASLIEPGLNMAYELSTQDIISVDLPELSQLFDLNLPPASDLPFDDILADLDLQTVLDEYQDHTHAEPLLKQGLAQGHRIEHANKHELHFAARQGDVKKIKLLLESGHDVDAKDHLQSSPLHLAALFGKQDAVKVLLNAGAKAVQPTYNGQTPLHLALMKKHYDIAQMLVKDHHANPNQVTKNNENAFTIVCDQLTQALRHYQDKPTDSAHKDILKMITTIDVMSQHCGHYCHATNASNRPNLSNLLPVSLLLKVQAGLFSTTSDHDDALLNLSKKISAFDPSEKIFGEAKNLLQVFPTGGQYRIKLDSSHDMLVKADGSSSNLSTKMAAKSLAAFADSISADKTGKLAAFQALETIFDLSHELDTHRASKDVAQQAFDMVEAGQTLVFPTGWNGHFVEVILSKKHGLYGVANSGESFQDFEPGVNFYKIEDAIDADFIHQLLTNHDQMHFEFDRPYQYGLLNRVELLPSAKQQYGNCTWQSQKVAIEGVLYLELLDQGKSALDAAKLAKSYCEEWHGFHQQQLLDNYFDNNPALPAKAFADILITLHDSKTFQPHNMQAKACAKVIANQLVGPHYYKECKELVNDDDGHYSAALQKLLPKYGVDVYPMLDNPGVMDVIAHAFGNYFPYGNADDVAKHKAVAPVQHEPMPEIVHVHPE